MKKILIVTIGILLLTNLSFGQNKYTPHVKGDNAMLFEFSGLGFLFADSYKGGFGYKKFINDKTAIRGAFSIHNTSETFKGYLPEGYSSEDGYDKEFGIGFEAAAEIHRNKGKVDPYYGAGGGFSMTRTKYADFAFAAPGNPIVQGETK